MLGGYGSVPFQVGGGESVLEVEHRALLDAYAPGWSADPDTENWAEAFAHARIVSMIWAINRRLRNQALPMRMLENLPVWEQATSLRPLPGDSDNDRRRKVAAKLRGLANNAVSDIGDVSRAIMGANFDALTFVAPGLATTYWPGINPGPPGFEWSSNRAVIGVRVTKTGLDDEAFVAKRAALADALRGMVPAWLHFVIGVGSQWVVNVGVVSQTFI